MARNKNGGFNKILNFIGLVDDEDPRENYGDEYQDDNYGRQQGYAPANRQRNNSRSDMRSSAGRSNTQNGRRSLPEPRNSGSRYDAPRASRSYDDYRSSSRRTSSRFSEETSYDDYSAPRAERASSRFDYSEPAPRYEEQPAPRNLPARSARGNRRSRTVMYSLHSLEDCCEVIDNLIANNTVVLTMDELDGRLMQRAVDTLSGAVFALHASIRKASDKTYLIAPMSVEVNELYDVDRRF